MVTAEGVFPKNGGDPLYASEVNKFNNVRWTQPLPYSQLLSVGLIKWNGSTWQTRDGDTSDSGVTWTSGGYAVAGEETATTFGAVGIASHQADGIMAKTADSGATWAAASASPPNANNIYVISLFNASVGLAAGVDSTPGEGIWYTSDGGDNWTQAVSGPTTTVNSIIMTSATVGFAVDISNNIWKTVDAGANWTDTTDNLANTKYRIFSEDATTIYFVDKASPSVQKYVNATSGPVSAGTLTNIFVASVGNTSSATSNVVLGSDGNYYWAYAPGTGTANAQVDIIRIFKWDGTSISMRDVPMACNEELKTRWWIADVGNTSVLIEVDGVLYLNVWDVILKIPLSTEGE